MPPRRPRPPLPHWLPEFGPQPSIPIAGVDEVGRGPLAGPVVAAAVIFDPRQAPPAVRDSKTLSPARRAVLAEEVRSCALAWALGSAEAWEIDELNILQASLLAMARALRSLTLAPGLALVDGTQAPREAPCPLITVPKGDGRLASIAAASILAKEARDETLRRLGERYPGYGFERHSGYPVPEHLAALAALGPTPAHRRSFAPVRRFLLASPQEKEPRSS